MPIEHCKITELPKISGSRGDRPVIEGGIHIPFDIKRVYKIFNSMH